MESTQLEKRIDYTFKDKKIIKEACTHRSYLNEHPSWGVPHNERLEFLGDAVLELATTEELYNRFPDYPEGQLTGLRSALVNYQMLAQVAETINLERFLFLSRGEAKDTGRAREVILANAFEALVGALYLDGGFGAAKNVINGLVMARLEEVIAKGLYKDAKSLLQEQSQKNLKVTPAYRVLKEEGPDHDKRFLVGVFFSETEIARGEGPSKQEAELDAARNAIEVTSQKK